MKYDIIIIVTLLTITAEASFVAASAFDSDESIAEAAKPWISRLHDIAKRSTTEQAQIIASSRCAIYFATHRDRQKAIESLDYAEQQLKKWIMDNDESQFPLRYYRYLAMAAATIGQPYADRISIYARNIGDPSIASEMLATGAYYHAKVGRQKEFELLSVAVDKLVRILPQDNHINEWARLYLANGCSLLGQHEKAEKHIKRIEDPVVLSAAYMECAYLLTLRNHRNEANTYIDKAKSHLKQVKLDRYRVIPFALCGNRIGCLGQVEYARSMRNKLGVNTYEYIIITGGMVHGARLTGDTETIERETKRLVTNLRSFKLHNYKSVASAYVWYACSHVIMESARMNTLTQLYDKAPNELCRVMVIVGILDWLYEKKIELQIKNNGVPANDEQDKKDSNEPAESEE